MKVRYFPESLLKTYGGSNKVNKTSEIRWGSILFVSAIRYILKRLAIANDVRANIMETKDDLFINKNILSFYDL